MTEVKDGKIVCQICGEETHAIKAHLAQKHHETSIEDYREMYPDAPLMSEVMIARLREKRSEAVRQGASVGDTARAFSLRPLHEVFDIPAKTDGVLNKRGQPIAITVLAEAGDDFAEFVPDVDPNYIFNIDLLRTVLMGVETRMNTYAVGHAGTGKSTLFEQVCARTRRPMLRIQHTVNTEESHILGQYVVKDGQTVWEPGPLQFCMKHGIVYLADEYDRGLPQVLSVYQPVLEGKALVTKDAPPEWRIVRPHENFRFLATGNTNGAGDETGLYPSTALQDFANYERFGLMVRVGWMPKDQEIAIVMGQARILKDDAKKLVEFATDIRAHHDKGKVGSPVSPRALINAGVVGRQVASFMRGIELAFLNRLNAVDRETCGQVAQRYFG